MVFVSGILVAKNGKMRIKVPPFKYPTRFLKSVKISRKINPEDLKIHVTRKTSTAKIGAIVRKDGVASAETIVDMSILNGELLPQPSEDLIKIVCLEIWQVQGTEHRQGVCHAVWTEDGCDNGEDWAGQTGYCWHWGKRQRPCASNK